MGKHVEKRRFTHDTVAIGTAMLMTLLGCGSSESRDLNRVATDKGVVVGIEKGTMRQFLGIPYAAPPVGQLRWRAPQAVAAWSQARNSSTFGPACAQPGGATGAAGTAEDCLYLNVFTPTGPGPFPVMVWVHGGELTTGEGALFDPTALVNQGIIVVTINYRLGVLGFLAHAALSAEGDGTSGSYGLMDQQAALRWVKTNIASFGGNPGNVTLIGESAGGFSVHAQMASPGAAGLFHKAIVQSGAYFESIAPPMLAAAQTVGAEFASQAGCGDQSLACLRALPVDKIVGLSTTIRTGGQMLPAVGTPFLPIPIDEAFSTGKFNKVPVIEGTNLDEYSFISGTSIDPALGHPISAAEYPGFVTQMFGTELASTILDYYRLNTTNTPAQTFDDVGTDFLFACSGRKVVRRFAAAGLPVYAYEFADTNAPQFIAFPPRPEGYGAYHAAEIQYIFPVNGTDSMSATPFTAAQADLSRKMVSFWAQFAKSGNPNASGSTEWPRYDAASDTYLTLAPGALATNTRFAEQHKCAFWTPGV
ncbi:carboxylesterase/lipase family protein [Massilia sp. METH4]|uniref:carboxylesterase/lipase family protein n=1 Tax=Massilia sp. METH4 TaxID=3123041 RepID=UPI0030D06564